MAGLAPAASQWMRNASMCTDVAASGATPVDDVQLMNTCRSRLYAALVLAEPIVASHARNVDSNDGDERAVTAEVCQMRG